MYKLLILIFMTGCAYQLPNEHVEFEFDMHSVQPNQPELPKVEHVPDSHSSVQ